MRTRRRSPGIRALLGLCMPVLVLACGDGNPAEPPGPGPTTGFPRLFTSQSVACTTLVRSGFTTAGEQDVFIEEEVEATVESSADDYFAGQARNFHRTLFNANTGDLIRVEHFAQIRPDAVEGTWKVTLTAAKDWAWNAVGVGIGELSERSIEFRMEAISNCGYKSTGTIR